MRRIGSVSSDRPFALTADSRGRRRLTEVDAAAARSGLAVGMALADARTLLPDVIVEPDDPAATAALLGRLADWCGRYTPWTAVDGADGIWLDIAGCAHLFGGEAALLDDLQARLAGLGFAVRAALAPTPGVAWALARFAEGTAIVAEEEMRKRIADLPVSALRLEPEVAASLNRLGLRRIADLYPLPRAPFAARFGEETARRLDQALGRMAEPISPRRHVAPFRSRLAFAEPIGTAEDIARGLERLLKDLLGPLARAARGVRRLELTLFRVDGTIQQAAIGTAQGTRDPHHLARLFRERLTAIDPGFGIETMLLAAPETEKLVSNQVALKGESEGGGDSLPALLDRLGNRLGFGRLHALQPAESHLPERAQRLIGDSHLMRDVATVLKPPGRIREWAECFPLNKRPLRLLRDPEPMVPMTPEEEDGTPPSVFRWRHRLYQLRRIDGPERISPEWWRQDRDRMSAPRDYWRIEDAEGQRLWLYREVGGAMESRWFVHGLFA